MMLYEILTNFYHMSKEICGASFNFMQLLESPKIAKKVLHTKFNINCLRDTERQTAPRVNHVFIGLIMF